jgi:hypothetical protein
LKTLNTAPRSLLSLFPELKTLEEKAYKFLEVYYDCGNQLRRTGRKLRLDAKTIKNIAEHLSDTVEGVRFNGALMEQTEDFYSSKVLTQLFESHTKEIERLEKGIQQKDGKDRLDLIKEKRMWTKNMLDAALACKPHLSDANKESIKEHLNDDKDKYEDLLADFNPGDSTN